MHSLEAVACADPHHQVAVSRGECGTTVVIGLLRGDGIELGIVIDTEVHRGVRDGLVVSVHHIHHQVLGGSISGQTVYFGVTFVAGQDLFAPVVVGTEHSRVDKHGSGCSPVEPSLVQDSLWFAGSHEAPTAVALVIVGYPYLHPCVVAVGVRPSGTIDLTGGDANGSHGSHCERTLLATTTYGIGHGGERRRRAAVAGLIAHLLVAPVVDLQSGLFHGHALQAWSQLLVYDGTGIVQSLIVDTDRHHKMTPLRLGNYLAPRHFTACLLGHGHLALPVVTGIVHTIGRGHVTVQKSYVIIRLALA